MAQISADRVRDTSTSTGTGAFVVTGTAPTAFRTFSAVCTTNDTFYYAIQHQTANEWEVGLGTYSSANTITRTTVYASSAGGSAVTFSSGTKDVFLTLAATRTVQLDENGAIAGITDAGNLTFTGNARRITGDFSNATLANRVYAQTSTTNGSTSFGVIPNGTGASSAYNVFAASDPTNTSFAQLRAGTDTSDVRLTSGISGSGSYLPMTFYTGGSERMRIDTSGNVGIGTSSPGGYKLNVSGTALVTSSVVTNSDLQVNPSGYNLYLRNIGGTNRIDSYNSPITATVPLQLNASQMTFLIADAEKMRIDSSGNLLVGKTASNGATDGIELRANGSIFSTRPETTNAASTMNVYSSGASAFRFYVEMDGKVNATNTTIAAISDQRLKENVRDIDVGLAAIMALKPRQFDWKTGKGKNIKNDRGWIAQEFEQVFPEMVGTWKDPSPEGEEPYKSVCADLIPVLVKAIQELKAQNDELKARVAALEDAQ